MKKYKIIALIGESGAGKDTILQKVCRMPQPHLHSIVSYTTRPPREGEVDGENYFFISADEFANLIFDDKMLEATTFREWCYGTGYDSLDINKVNIGVFNPDGVELLSHLDEIELYVYWIKTHPKERLLRSLTRELNPDVDEIVRRYLADEEAFAAVGNDIHIIELKNDTEEDLKIAVRYIQHQAKFMTEEPLGKFD